MPSPIFSPEYSIAVADERPAVIQARPGPVQLVASARPVLDGPEAALAVERRALDVAVAVGPDLGFGLVAAREGVVLRGVAVSVDAEDLAEAARQVLGLAPGLLVRTLAHGHEQLAIRREDEARAEMLVAVIGRHLPEDDLEAVELARAAALHELGLRHRGAVALLAGLGIADVDRGGPRRSSG